MFYSPIKTQSPEWATKSAVGPERVMNASPGARRARRTGCSTDSSGSVTPGVGRSYAPWRRKHSLCRPQRPQHSQPSCRRESSHCMNRELAGACRASGCWSPKPSDETADDTFVVAVPRE
eukprot:1606143-Alexandrium_andersonii.AAC.1